MPGHQQISQEVRRTSCSPRIGIPRGTDRSRLFPHAAKKPFDVVGLEYGDQILWPDHCVQGIHGARLHAKLKSCPCAARAPQGLSPHVDSYSAFTETDRKTPTGLGGYLRERGIDCICMRFGYGLLCRMDSA